MVAIDTSKAFDSVDCSKMLAMIRNLAQSPIERLTYDLLAEYYSVRYGKCGESRIKLMRGVQ